MESQEISFFQRLILKTQYTFENLKDFNRYPYILDGELHDNNTLTELVYRIRGKRDIYKATAQEICNDPALISKFHPLHVRTIAYITGVEQILEAPEEKRADRFKAFKDKLFSDNN